MVEKKTEKNSTSASERKLFGASAFFEVKDEDEGATILSLDSLREAFAVFDVEGNGQTSVLVVPADNERLNDEIPPLETDDEPSTDGEPSGETDEFGTIEELSGTDAVELSPKSILEAMLFVGNRENRPLTAEFAAERMRNVFPEEIDEAVAELNRNYLELDCPYLIVQEEDGYRMILRPEYSSILERFYGKIRESTLSQQAIDLLAIVAYQQPITADEVQKLKKEPCSAGLSQLVRRGLLSAERETRNKKKMLVYRTTERFLELFHLESLDDLPIAEEINFR